MPHACRERRFVLGLMLFAFSSLCLGLLTVAPSTSAQEELRSDDLVQDVQTLMYLPFDNSLNATDGEAPAESSGLTFESGIAGQGVLVEGTDVLRYNAAGNIDPAAGTIEFWIKPQWSGSSRTNNYIFNLGGQLFLVRDANSNLRFVMRNDDSEAFRSYNLGLWTANSWHHIAATWTVPGTMKVYVDGVERISHTSSSQDLITSLPASMSVGSFGTALQANAVIDEFRISNVARSASEIAGNFLQGVTVTQLTMNLTLSEMYVGWRKRATLTAVTNLGTLELPQQAATWTSSSNSAATIDADGTIRALAAGNINVTATVNGVQASKPILIKAAPLPMTKEPINPSLSTPAANSQFEVPVVIIRYLPTPDGVNLDTAYSPDFYSPNPITLANLKRTIDTYDLNVKFMLEEGSRFRGYKNPSAPPSLGYRVVDYITIYEPEPQGDFHANVNGKPVYIHDLHQTMERINGAHYVNNLGVKEFWIWYSSFDANFPSYNPNVNKPEYSRVDWESNMSSPVTGDISNSNRDNRDLPIYNRSYIVYGQNFRRTQAEAIHNHGHQIEHMLTHVEWLRHSQQNAGNSYFNTDMFWRRFVGRGNGENFLTGRCGWTHMPPNTNVNYDYQNPSLVESDIEDWNPEGTGQKKPLNAATWGNLPYAWPAPNFLPQKTESQWYIYWMQSIPGRDNNLNYGQNRITNWWEFTADWDGRINSGLGLYKSLVPPTVQFNNNNVPVDESSRSAQIIVNRTGDSSTAFTVSYETANQTASDRSDYTASYGTLRFAPGETSKTLTVFITDDALAEGAETFTVTLSFALDALIGLASTVTFTINDNDVASGPSPVGDTNFNAAFFVRQHYIDFLNREPDSSGLNFWANQINECGTNVQCRELRKINVSAAFYISIEFQQTGYLVYRMHQAAFNRRETLPLREFLPDTQQIGRGVVVNAPGWEEQLEQNKRAFADSFVTRRDFLLYYPVGMSATSYVNTLSANTGESLTAAEKQTLINALTNGTMSRAQVLRAVAENQEFQRREFNRAFVLMQYFGYLRRNPNQTPDTNFDGFNFWLNKLNEFGGNFVNAEMVKAFIISDEYKLRFGQ